MNSARGSEPQALAWQGEVPGRLLLLDQTLLPGEERWLALADVAGLIEAVRRLAVRGAPALGCAAAYGVVLAAQAGLGQAADPWLQTLEGLAAELRKARPTAVNLALGVDRLTARARELAATGEGMPSVWTAALLAEARAFHEEDRRLCQAIGEHGAALLPTAGTVLTHCHAGALATGGRGTALSLVYAAVGQGKRIAVLADETRPLLQGARLTVWELQRAGVPVTLQCDGAAASAIASGKVQAVVVGADRVAANGDVANKVGTYALALAAHAHQVPFYVAAPSTTVDFACPDGAAIPIEERPAAEVRGLGEQQWAAAGVAVSNPAFDVTPAALVSALITERGVLTAPDRERLAAHLGRAPEARSGSRA